MKIEESKYIGAKLKIKWISVSHAVPPLGGWGQMRKVKTRIEGVLSDASCGPSV